MALVSIIVPAYNASPYIEQALLSASRQSYRSHEILVVDDASSDNTAQIIESLSSQDSRIRLLRHQQNLGISSARNTAIGASRGDYIAFLDADDLWDEEKLEHQLAALKANPAAGLVFTASRAIDANGQVTNDNLSRGKTIPSGRISARQFIIERYPMITSSVMIRRECLNQVGVFDPRYSTAEDFDLWLRILGDYAQCYVPQVLTSYRDITDSASKNALRNRTNKVKLLENLQRESPALTAEMGQDFAVYLHRQYLGLAKLEKQTGQTQQSRKHYQNALSLPVPAMLKLRALVCKKRYC